MLRSVEGVYFEGKVTLLEPVPPAHEGKVIVTFMQSYEIDASDNGMSQAELADRRLRLRVFHNDFDQPESDM